MLRCLGLWMVGLAMSAMAVEEGGVTDAQARVFLKLAVAGLDREYPHKTGHVMRDAEDRQSPREMHPVFYGHFDWHSSVHGHWTLVRLLRLKPELAAEWRVRELLAGRFSVEALEGEAAYFRVKENRSFERMYGWAWLLRLVAELHAWDDGDAKRWREGFRPLEQEIVGLAKGYLPKLEWPVRCGFHPESAFPLAQMWDYAVVVGDEALRELVEEKARSFYGKDRAYPVAYEPSGNDFFSPGLNVADLMRRVLPAEEYREWLDGYFPGLRSGGMGNLLAPVAVSDPTDGHLIHLAGLNFNRAWTMRGMVEGLAAGDEAVGILRDSARRHFDQGMKWVESGHYEGEHWLGSFALYALTEGGERRE